jgi:hypothetical protein
MMKHLFFILSIFVGLMMLACDDQLDIPADGQPHFSKDTLRFDTVFTTVGSATAKILIYNSQSKPVTIQRLQLAGGSASPFRVNVDGAIHPEHIFESVTIRGRDSLYVFVEVTVDPQQSDAPVLLRDSLVMTTSKGSKRMVMEAFGQDMLVLRSVTILSDTLLDATLPYLVYGNLVVDTLATLRLAAGTRLFFHHNANLVVHGHLRAEGTFEKPISMRGDRLDKIGFVTPVPYHLVAGQWGGVYLLNPKGEHLLRHVTINSGYVGIYYVNQDKNHKPHLEISNSQIHNFLFYNLVAINGDMTVSNTVISNSGGYTVYLNGGKHAFYHCTITNYFSSSEVQSVARDRAPAFMLMSLPRSYPMETIVYNSIITGSAQNELSLASRRDSLFNADIAHSYIKRTKPSDLQQFRSIRWSEPRDTVFLSIREDLDKDLKFNFQLDSVSPARGIADLEISQRFPIDLNGKNRLADGAPDAGAYEWSSEF